MGALYQSPESMEPLLPLRDAGELDELAVEAIRRSGMLYGRLPEATREVIAGILRVANCYYSNLIEGHSTHPADIARALGKDFHREPRLRALQDLAKAHVDCQVAMERRLAAEPELDPCSPGFLCWIHREFYDALPESFRSVPDPVSGGIVTVVPGALRDIEVQVGAHVAPAAASLPRFLARFAEGYASRRHPPHRRIVAMAAAHHRLAWIHPFADGNGRVARLVTHAMAIRLKLDGHGLWTLSRGLARTRDRYFALLHDADLPREGPLDGRGNLSDRHLHAFCRYLLTQMLDQMEFMHGCIRPGELERRLELLVHGRNLFGRQNESALRLLREAVNQGTFARGEAAGITGKAPSTAREILGRVLDAGLLASSSPKGKVHLAIPAAHLDVLFPGLFPH